MTVGTLPDKEQVVADDYASRPTVQLDRPADGTGDQIDLDQLASGGVADRASLIEESGCMRTE